MSNKNKTSYYNEKTGEAFVHKQNSDGSAEFYYGPQDSAESKNHGHATIKDGNVTFNRQPKGE